MRSLFNRRKSSTSLPPQAKKNIRLEQAKRYLGKPRSGTTLKSQFARQFHQGSHYTKAERKAMRKANVKTVRMQAPHYMPIGSNLVNAHIRERKVRYFGEGIF